MRRHNAENEAAKREYVAWLRNAGGRSEATIDLALAAIHAFEAHNRYGNFKGFRRTQAISFKTHLGDQTHPRTGKPLSKATMNSRLNCLRAFFEWLSREPGYRSKVAYSDAAYFNLTANDARIATAARPQRFPSLAQVIHVLEAMPADSPIQRRDRAVIAFILLTGARDRAVTTLRLKHVRLRQGIVEQDAREVKTKAAKTFSTAFFPVGDLPRQIVGAWIGELASDHLFGPDDPLFPAPERRLGPVGQFDCLTLSRTGWATATPIREIFRKAFVTAGLEYFPPHSLRRTLMQLAYDLDLTPRQLKAWSQNLGHASVLTSLVSYGQLTVAEQTAEIDRIGHQKPQSAAVEAAVRRFLGDLAATQGGEV